MEKLKLGILGFGNMGSCHSDNIAKGKTKNIELCAICDIDEERRKKARELYPDVKVFETADTDCFKTYSALCKTLLDNGKKDLVHNFEVSGFIKANPKTEPVKIATSLAKICFFW